MTSVPDAFHSFSHGARSTESVDSNHDDGPLVLAGGALLSRAGLLHAILEEARRQSVLLRDEVANHAALMRHDTADPNTVQLPETKRDLSAFDQAEPIGKLLELLIDTLSGAMSLSERIQLNSRHDAAEKVQGSSDIGIPLATAGYKAIAEMAKAVFISKHQAYGAAWWAMRPIALVDQIYIKARRMQHLQEIDRPARVDEDPALEYVGVFNYALLCVARTRYESASTPPPAWSDTETSSRSYDQLVAEGASLLDRKNHDYGEAWALMDPGSFADEILSRTFRLKALLGSTPRHDRAIADIEAQLFDAANYAALALAQMDFPGTIP